MADIQLIKFKNQHYIKTVSGKVVAQSIAFRVVSISWQGVAPFPWYLNAKGPTPIGSTCVAHTSPQRGSRDVIASLASVRLTGWPVAWNWRRAVLSADAGLLVETCKQTHRHVYRHAHRNTSHPSRRRSRKALDIHAHHCSSECMIRQRYDTIRYDTVKICNVR